VKHEEKTGTQLKINDDKDEMRQTRKKTYYVWKDSF